MNTTGSYPRLHVDTAAVAAVGQAGGVLLTETIRATGLDRVLSEQLSRWRKPLAVHDPAKIVLDLAITLALGGDALCDLSTLRAEPGVFGRVASDPTVSRTIAALAGDADRVLAAIGAARQEARAAAWALAADQAPDAAISTDQPLVIDLDATLITAHSEKEDAKPTFKRGFGFHPLCAFVDHGPAGTGEMLAIRLRPGNAGSNTAADHIAVVKDALAQLPDGNPRPGKSVLIRTDGAGGTKQFVTWLTGRRLSYSVGFTLPFHTPQLYKLLTDHKAWEPALDADGDVRDGAAVAELTGILDLDGWPDGMRVIVRRERPHPGAQLRFDDVDGYRLTAFATNTRRGQLQQLELRHRRRGRCEDRIRQAKDTGLRNLPLHGFDQNRIWCAIVALAGDLTAWAGLLAHAQHEARRWEPKKLRYRLFTIPATIAHHERRVILHLANRSRWADIVVAGISRIRALPTPSG
ncbi:IS1380 family transposase [Microbacterium sp.]|uniref:IS1380 family transposase n=1 Tax=Microbacterium sp. TaxID=51671 RepID=UPI003C772940